MIEAERKCAVGVDGAAEAHASVERESVPPLEQQPDHLEEILVPAHGDPVLGDAAESGHHSIVERLVQRSRIENGLERHPFARRRHAGQRRVERLDLETVDADDGMAVVHQQVRERESRRPHADDQRAAAGRAARHRPAQVERVPARQQRIDLESPGEREDILQDARLGLRNVDRIGLLVDARFHAIVTDPMPGGGDERIVDADNGQRGHRPAFGTELVELRDLLLERAAGERHPEGTFLERILEFRRAGDLFFQKAVRAGVLPLLVAPDAVVRMIERTNEIHAGVGQREPVTAAQVAALELPRVDAAHVGDFERNELHRVDLARRPEEHADLVRGAALQGVRGPGRVTKRNVERCRVAGFVGLPACHRIRESKFSEGGPQRGVQIAPQRASVKGRRDFGAVGVHRLALNELPLDGIERRKFVVPPLQRT